MYTIGHAILEEKEGEGEKERERERGGGDPYVRRKGEC